MKILNETDDADTVLTKVCHLELYILVKNKIY
jgi:hypothetical protein